MFLTLIIGLFTGLPVAVVLGGVTVLFGAIAIGLGEMRLVQASLLPNRIFGGSIQNQVLIAAPMFIFMGVLLEKSRLAEDLLITLQKLLRAVPGGLALAVTAMGTILAAATGIIGASVVMLTVLALPTMLKRGYSPELASGTVVSAGTLGILIPPSVMLVFMGDILTINLARLFVDSIAARPGFSRRLYDLYSHSIDTEPTSGTKGTASQRCGESQASGARRCCLLPCLLFSLSLFLVRF